MFIRGNIMDRLLFLLVSICILLSACSPAATPSIPVVNPPVIPATTAEWIQVYFTNPIAPNNGDYSGGADQVLADAIGRARLTVDVAAYSLNLWSIRDALIDAHRRGVTVRVVMESDNMDVNEVQDLKDAGIPVTGDRHEGLMHDKFVVIDRSEVWTGSMNFTVGGTYKDNNNLIRIRSEQAAQDYTVEFEQMFVGGFFGPDKISQTPYPHLMVAGTPIDILFSPQDGIAARVVSLIRSAKESIYFMAFSFTSNDIGSAILDRAQAGVTVAGVMDAEQVLANQGTEYDPFLQAGLNVRKDGNTGLMHHKVIIIDRRIVLTGSYNFTQSAESSNDENMVIIDNADIAALYLAEFQKVFNQARQTIQSQ